MFYKMSLVIEVLLISKCLSECYGRKMSIDINFIIYVALDIVIFEMISDNILPDLAGILIYPITFFYAFKTYKGELKRLIINLVLSFVFMSLLQIIFIYMENLLVGRFFKEEINNFLVYIMMIVGYNILIRHINMKNIAQYFYSFWKEIGIILFGGCCIIAISMIITKTKMRFYVYDFIPWFIMIFVTMILAIIWVKYKERAINAEMQLQIYELYQESYKNLIDEIRIKQHDFNEHISAIYNQHIVYHDYDSLVQHQKQYCDSIFEDNKYTKLLKVGDSALAGYLYGKFIEAEKKKIKVYYEIIENDIIKSIPTYKTINIVGNLMKNAIEAMNDVDVKRMNIFIYDKDGYSIIVVENTAKIMEPKELSRLFKMGYSNKGHNRGLGLNVVKRVADEYNMQISCGNDIREHENWIYFMLKKKSDMHQ